MQMTNRTEHWPVLRGRARRRWLSDRATQRKARALTFRVRRGVQA